MPAGARAHTGVVLLAVVLIGLLALPYLVSAAVRVIRRQYELIAEQRRPAADSLPSIEKVTADLRRLRAQLEARENRPGLTGKGMRMGAVRIAYVQVLGIACHQLEVPPPAVRPALAHPAGRDLPGRGAVARARPRRPAGQPDRVPSAA